MYDTTREPSECSFSVTLNLERDFETFSDADQRDFLGIIQQVLQKHGNVEVVHRKRGSVLLTIKLSASETLRLLEALESGALAPYGVVDAQVGQIVVPRGLLRPGPYYPRTVCWYAVSPKHANDVLGHPNVVQHLRNGISVSPEKALCSLYVKEYGRPHSPGHYTALVLVQGVPASDYIDLWAGFRVYSREVEHSSSWEPLNILSAFLDVYGVDLILKGVGTQRLFRATRFRPPQRLERGPLLRAYTKSIQEVMVTPETGPVESFALEDWCEDEGEILVECAFAVARRRYAIALAGHHVDVPREELA